MSIKDWQNGRKLNIHAPEIEDMFAIDYPQGEEPNDVLLERQAKRNRSKINQAR